MTYTVSITRQGQISIPAPLRRKLGLDRTKKALLIERDGEILIEPVQDLLELKGSLKNNLSVSPKQLRKRFEEYLAGKSK